MRSSLAIAPRLLEVKPQGHFKVIQRHTAQQPCPDISELSSGASGADGRSDYSLRGQVVIRYGPTLYLLPVPIDHGDCTFGSLANWKPSLGSAGSYFLRRHTGRNLKSDTSSSFVRRTSSRLGSNRKQRVSLSAMQMRARKPTSGAGTTSLSTETLPSRRRTVVWCSGPSARRGARPLGRRSPRVQAPAP